MPEERPTIVSGHQDTGRVGVSSPLIVLLGLGREWGPNVEGVLLTWPRQHCAMLR